MLGQSLDDALLVLERGPEPHEIGLPTDRRSVERSTQRNKSKVTSSQSEYWTEAQRGWSSMNVSAPVEGLFKATPTSASVTWQQVHHTLPTSDWSELADHSHVDVQCEIDCIKKDGPNYPCNIAFSLLG